VENENFAYEPERVKSKHIIHEILILHLRAGEPGSGASSLLTYPYYVLNFRAGGPGFSFSEYFLLGGGASGENSQKKILQWRRWAWVWDGFSPY